MIPVRPRENGRWYKEIEDILYDEKAVVKQIHSPEKHDLMMDILQGLAHTKHMLTVDTTMKLLKEYRISLNELLEYSTAFYEKTFDLDGRLVAGNPDLYVAIQTESEQMPKVLYAFRESLIEHIHNVTEKDLVGFRTRFQEWKHFMGEYAEQASKRTDNIIGKPIGMEIVYDKKTRELVAELLRRRIESEKYRAHLEHTRIPDGELAKLDKFPLARYTIWESRKYDGEWNIAFFMRDRSHPEHPEKPSIFFSPMITDPEKERVRFPNSTRFQMFNSVADPYLNLFDIYERTGLLEKIGPLVAYRAQRE